MFENNRWKFPKFNENINLQFQNYSEFLVAKVQRKSHLCPAKLPKTQNKEKVLKQPKEKNILQIGRKLNKLQLYSHQKQWRQEDNWVTTLKSWKKEKKKSTKNSITREKYFQKIKVNKNIMIKKVERIYHQQGFTTRNKNVTEVESKLLAITCLEFVECFEMKKYCRNGPTEQTFLTNHMN